MMVVFDGCGRQEAQKPLDKVTVQLLWTHQSQFAGLYAADQLGYYADEGLEVTLLPRQGPGFDPLIPVVEGGADFGIVYGVGMITARSKGLPVTAIATIYRIQPMVFMTKDSSNIKTPHEFPGHTMKTPASGGAFTTFYAMMTRLGIDPESVKQMDFGFDLSPFLSGKVDIWPSYITNEVQTVRKKGYDVNLIFPDDYGVHLYGDVLYTTDKLVRNNPDLVLRFLRATLKGWRWAVENPREAGKLALKYNPDLDAEHQADSMQASVPLIHTGEDPIGWMRSEVWKGMYAMLTKQNILDKPVELNKVFTTSFLQKIYKAGNETDD